ncbi:hypothetical protein Barb4_02267 [Bacteroidales bacterium Barb4]|nr:hypothetical protein Barb4_02267 [Bacteroidales bacterium Barb4]
MQHSEMRGYKDNTIRGILKGYRGFQPHVNVGLFILFFQNSLDDVVLLTPHFAALHVGLKSLALSGHHRVALSVNPTFRKPLNAGYPERIQDFSPT